MVPMLAEFCQNTKKNLKKFLKVSTLGTKRLMNFYKNNLFLFLQKKCIHFLINMLSYLKKY